MAHDGFEIVPSTLQLFGGPHQQPFGTLEAVDTATGRPVNGALEWSCSNAEFIFEPKGVRATVGAYRSGSATVTARDPKSGRSASAQVSVAILDGGMSGGRMA